MTRVFSGNGTCKDTNTLMFDYNPKKIVAFIIVFYFLSSGCVTPSNWMSVKTHLMTCSSPTAPPEEIRGRQSRNREEAGQNPLNFSLVSCQLVDFPPISWGAQRWEKVWSIEWACHTWSMKRLGICLAFPLSILVQFELEGFLQRKVLIVSPSKAKVKPRVSATPLTATTSQSPSNPPFTHDKQEDRHCRPQGRFWRNIRTLTNPEGPNLEKKQSRLNAWKFQVFAWNSQSRLKTSISLEFFNLDLENYPQK